jgi:hypothetical protein
MKAEEVKQKLLQYIDEASPEQLQNLLSFVEEEEAGYDVETEGAPWDDEEFVKEMDRRSREFDSGVDKGYSVEEVQKEIRTMLEKRKKE